MKETREQKRVRLLAAAEAVIEELLAWDETNSRPNLTRRGESKGLAGLPAELSYAISTSIRVPATSLTGFSK